MLIRFHEHNFYLEIVPNIDKFKIFVISREENCSTKVLEEVLTLFFYKFTFFSKEEAESAEIYLYLNKFCLSRFIDSKKLFKVQLAHSSRIFILTKEQASEEIRLLFKNSVRVTSNPYISLDNFDYQLLIKNRKTENRMINFRRNRTQQRYIKFNDYVLKLSSIQTSFNLFKIFPAQQNKKILKHSI